MAKIELDEAQKLTIDEDFEEATEGEELSQQEKLKTKWAAMEALHGDGKTRFLGVSNVNLGQLEALCEEATVKPSFVQNRCYARRGWDWEVRALCRERGMVD